MLILASTSDSLSITAGGTQNLDCHTSFLTFVLATGVVTPSNQNTLVGTTSPTAIVAAPASGSYIGIHHVSIYNTGSVSETVAVNLINGSATETLVKITLLPGYTLMYEKGLGWVQLDASGGRIETPLAGRFLKTTVVLNGTTSFMTGASTNTIKARLQAGGGAGGGCPATAGENGGGGAAGGYAEWVVAVVPNTTYTCAVGAGGTGASAATGGAGGNTSLTISGVVCTANGGPGGIVGASATVPAKGGAAPAVSTNGTLNASGAPGLPCVPGASGLSGGGGSSDFGGGAVGISASGTGTAATGYGSGGSGGFNSTAVAETGGNGSPGILIIEEYS